MSTNEINLKVKDLRELRRMAEELDAEITAIQDEIKSHMDAAGVDELAGADYRITWKAVTSTRVDTTALKKALPDVVERFTKVITSRRFCLA